jgi:hypothetical protein
MEKLETCSPASAITIRKSTIGNRQSTGCYLPDLGSAKGLRKKRILFSTFEAIMLLKTQETPTKCMATSRTFSAKMLGFHSKRAQFCPYRLENRIVLAE